jgi:hypothetical protein
MRNAPDVRGLCSIDFRKNPCSGAAMTTVRRNPMSVTFLRTGERHYAVRAALAGRGIVEMNPAPGYDPFMPHDLQHFIVERALGIQGGIFGQLAAGGDARCFRVVPDRPDARAASRENRRRARKGRHLMSSHRSDSMRSERATYICWYDWLSHSDDPRLRAKALKMGQTAGSMLARIAVDERASFTPQKMLEIRSQFQRLSERWSVLGIGESITEPW